MARSCHRANHSNTLAEIPTSDMIKKEYFSINSHDKNDNLKRTLEAITQLLEIAIFQCNVTKSAALSIDGARNPSALKMRVVKDRDTKNVGKEKEAISDTVYLLCSLTAMLTVRPSRPLVQRLLQGMEGMMNCLKK